MVDRVRCEHGAARADRVIANALPVDLGIDEEDDSDPMLDGVQRQRLRPTFTRLELAFIGLAFACFAGQFARLPRIAPGHGCSGCRDRSLASGLRVQLRDVGVNHAASSCPSEGTAGCLGSR